ncbi:calmodulin-binding protein 60 A-like isoform X2 [Actinidia eriantha]|uniref:calmodulin-binding protein 60 A-like isoform X2 n=1 Tax=Actinidia eriantha TaxID=165200 RepID=UPI00258BCF0C|nr:calmodulin-binding protein 60 A-like isoform X2 [Actinidia eriantha]
MPYMFPFQIKEKIPSVVKTIWTRMNQNSEDRVHSSEPRNLELQFQNKPALSVLTGAHIKGEDGSSIKIALIDVVKREVVKSGFEASAKVEILVLRADPDGDEGHVWTPVEFKLNIVTDRKVNLRKKTFVELKEGMGSLGEIYFPNSRFSMKKCQLRLEARIDGTFNGARVREAKSDSFTLEDYRKTYVKKHDFPSLSDEVWRLKNISRCGQCKKRLHKKNIKTVKDFLKKFFLDREGLQDILGKGMSEKALNETVKHGLKCILDDKYLYYHPGSQPKTGVVFNDVGQIMGRLVESHYVPVADLSENERAEAQKLVVSAFEHWGGVIPYDGSSSNSLQIPSVPNVGTSHMVAGTDDPQPSTAPVAEGQKLEVSAFEHWEGVITYDGSSSNSLQIPSVPNVGTSHMVAGTDDPQPSTAPVVSTSDLIAACDPPQPIPSYPETISASDSIGTVIGMENLYSSSDGSFQYGVVYTPERTIFEQMVLELMGENGPLLAGDDWAVPIDNAQSRRGSKMGHAIYALIFLQRIMVVYLESVRKRQRLY